MNPRTIFRFLAVVGRSGPCLARTWIALLGFAAVATAQLTDSDFPALGPDLPVGQGVLVPCLESLEGSVQCGRFRVVENRGAGAAPSPRRTLDIAFVLARALDKEQRTDDAITFFLGGPGSSPIGQSMGLAQLFSDLRESRDLLFVDFRGVGRSGDLDCTDAYPRGMRSRFEELLPLDHLRNCAARLGQEVDLTQYTSIHSIDDLEELRRWLDLGPFNLYTGSYGVREALIYARRHPDSIRTMVLDAAKGLDVPGYLSHARNLQNALDLILVECRSDAACSTEFRDLEAELKAVLDRVRRDPPTVVLDGETVPVTPIVAGYALRGLLYSRGADVPSIVHAAASGDWKPLAAYYLQRQGWVARDDGDAGYHFSVICAEDIDRVDDEDIAPATEGTFLGSLLIDVYRAACAVWPHAEMPSSHWKPVRTEIPALVINGERDPVTPPAAGAALTAQLPNSIHVVLRKTGHGAFAPCPQSLVRQLIRSGGVDAIDVSCND